MQSIHAMYATFLCTTALVLVAVHESFSSGFGPASSGICQDRVTWCRRFQSYGYCSLYQGYMAKQCKETCGFCSDTCFDFLPGCNYAAGIGYCERYKQWGEKFCKKSCGACQKSCGRRPSVFDRIVGGTISPRNAWPWMTQILTQFGFAFCGGSLITKEWVVTAAHCVSDLSPSDIVVRLGAHYRNHSMTTGSEQTLNVSQIILHPQYNTPLIFSNDIALLKLSSPASINPKVSPVCVPTENKPSGFVANMTCYVTGWGTTQFLGNVSNELFQARVPIQSNSTCHVAYPGSIDDSMLCAGPLEGGVDSCQGDSGGPMVCNYDNRWYLEGVVSWGVGCASPGKFGVYANVRHLNNWITKTMMAN